MPISPELLRSNSRTMCRDVITQWPGISGDLAEILCLRPRTWVIRVRGNGGIATVKHNGYATIESILAHDVTSWRQVIQQFTQDLRSIHHRGAILPATTPGELTMLMNLGMTTQVDLSMCSIELSSAVASNESEIECDRATLSDLDSIPQWYDNMPAPMCHPNAELRTWLDVRPDGFLVARDASGEAVGAVFVHDGGNRDMWIRGLAVSPLHRHRGIARFLVCAAHSYGQAQRFRRASVATAITSLWQAFGYHSEGLGQLCYATIQCTQGGRDV